VSWSPADRRAELGVEFVRPCATAVFGPGVVARVEQALGDLASGSPRELGVDLFDVWVVVRATPQTCLVILV